MHTTQRATRSRVLGLFVSFQRVSCIKNRIHRARIPRAFFLSFRMPCLRRQMLCFMPRAYRYTECLATIVSYRRPGISGGKEHASLRCFRSIRRILLKLRVNESLASESFKPRRTLRCVILPQISSEPSCLTSRSR